MDDDDNAYIWMHNQLSDLKREIAFQKGPKDVARCSRLWNHKEAPYIIKLKKAK